MQTTKTNGTNGHGTSSEQVTALLAQLAQVLNAPQQAQQSPAVEPAKPKAPRKPRAVKAAEAPKPPVKGEYPEHDHVSALVLDVVIPEANRCRTGVKGAGFMAKVRCHCGVEGWLEFPAAELEALCQTATWADDGEG